MGGGNADPQYRAYQISGNRPGEVRDCAVETYEDHCMAMAFSLIGLKTGKITILNSTCCTR